MRIKPLNDRVLVRFHVDEVTAMGIIIAPTKSKYADVVAVGPGRIDDSGALVPMLVKVGDTVLMPAYGGLEIKQDGETYELLYESAIEAIVETT